MSRPLWTSKDVAMAVSGGQASGWDAHGVSIDSRTLAKGDLFIALPGEKFDGHDYVAQAAAAGAAAALVEHPVPGVDLPQIAVPSTVEAMRALAVAARDRSQATRIAVTGSVGKTGTKEMLGKALAGQGATHVTQGNLNNHLGLPLSMARMPAETRFAIFELGMNHAGELTPLSRLVRPHIAIITAIELAHAEFFASTQDIAQAKAEIFEGLEADGTAILNRDSQHFQLLRRLALTKGAKHIIGFGGHIECEARLLDCAVDPDATHVLALIADRPLAYSLGAAGRHWAVNSLAVLAAALEAGASLELSASALGDMRAPKGRGLRHQVPMGDLGSFELIDDSYNASPASMRAAFATLSMMKPAQGGRRIAFLGDMLELGPKGPELHAGLTQALVENRIDLVFTAGRLMGELFESLPKPMQGCHASSSRELAPIAASAIRAGDVATVKGSAGSRMGLVVDALLALGQAPRKCVNGS
jgi:UDP-N-acetylmuramoyl-tripeptide--D-alanyl-D-alanine ligase